ncbi:hypothetical protein [Peterkaempfera bronchialis]|uniref:hypothetical protein n=1 Tax=Peterkaempfera bronchialis TaxID=2126346 RepID=UPI003C2C75AE
MSGRRHGLETTACIMDEPDADASGVLRPGGRRVDAVFRRSARSAWSSARTSPPT